MPEKGTTHGRLGVSFRQDYVTRTTPVRTRRDEGKGRPGRRERERGRKVLANGLILIGRCPSDQEFVGGEEKDDGGKRQERFEEVEQFIGLAFPVEEGCRRCGGP